MTVRVPRLPLALDPLIAEAKRRARHRRLLVGVLLAAVAAGLALTLGLPGGSSGGRGSAAIPARIAAIPAGTADCGNGRSAPAYAVSGGGFKPETYTTDTVTPMGTYLGGVTSIGGRVSMTVNTCDGAGAYTVKLIDTEQPRTFVAASVSWTR